ncbi:MAG: respiratory nitrate reductase subunit gamma [Spirochaetes bacterium]|nr:respiratory nitrate reductase subunit gamma [Spirochaetota bacterium]
MWSKVFYFTMVPMVYAAVAIFIGGLIFKLAVVLFSKRFKGSLATYPKRLPRPVGVAVEALAVPSAFKKDKVFWLFILAFHISFFLLFIGHLELIREFKWIQLIPHEVFLGAGAVGIVLIISVLYFLFRRFRSPWREISVPEDFFILILLFLTMFLGSHLHLSARFYAGGGAFDIPIEAYREYLSSLLALKPVVPDGIAYSPHYVLVALHIFLANLVLILIPFSKVVHMVFAFLSLDLKRK